MLLRQKFVTIFLLVLYCKLAVCCSEEQSHTVSTAHGPITKRWYKDFESYEVFDTCGEFEAYGSRVYATQDSKGISVVGRDDRGALFLLSNNCFLILRGEYERVRRNEEAKTVVQAHGTGDASVNK